MAILNRPTHGQPSVMIALWRTLRALGPLEKTELLGLCAPLPILTSDTQKQAARTLNTWMKLGLFVADGDLVAVAKDFEGVCTDPDQDPLFREMGAAALDVAMRRENNGDVGDPKGDEGAGASDFSYAMCWMLSQDPHESWSYDVVDQRQGGWIKATGPRPIQNDTRWSGLVDWACFFGLGWIVGVGPGSLCVDPTEAIRARLDRILGHAERLTQADFVVRLTDLLPVLHGGEYRKAAERHFPTEHQVDDAVFSVPLSHALLTLEAMGEIQLHNDPDAGQRRRLNDRRTDYLIARGRTASITHVSRA